MKHDTSDLILPAAFIGGSLIGGWSWGGFDGLVFAMLGAMAGFVIGRWRRK
jgi:hypothetical protein